VVVPRKRIALCFVCVFVRLGPLRAERLPIRTYTVADGLPRDRINRIVRDSRGFLWFCTAEGPSGFDGTRFTNFSRADGLPNRNVTNLLETRDGGLLDGPR
jgi:ligand-binding sensor domain-containing protein